ncbi:hypothetical protein HYX06_02015 [Candidatus Woesearchaeota archaeon]|nr:hypothetical protein [Candidatus Woesearchaeota archaeon]
MVSGDLMDKADASSKIDVQLAGFRDIDSSSMDIVDKNIQNHARRIAELAEKEVKIHITLKLIHEREKSEIYDIHAKVADGGKVYASHVTDRNLLAAVDKALQKVINEMD